MFCWNRYGFSHVCMINHQDRTVDNILLYTFSIFWLVVVCAVANSIQLGSLPTGPRDLFGVGQKLIVDPYFASAYMVFLKRGLLCNLEGWEESVNVCHLVPQDGGAEIP